MAEDETSEATESVVVESLLADCHGPNLNGDAYTSGALAALAQQLRVMLAAHGPLPAYLNFTDRQVGQVTECHWQPEVGQLRATAQIDLSAVRHGFKHLPKTTDTPETPTLAVAVRTRYTQCSCCGKQLYSVSDLPCLDAHHVIGAAAVHALVSIGVVAHNAFDRPAAAETEEVEVKNQPDDWPYVEGHTGDGAT